MTTSARRITSSLLVAGLFTACAGHAPSACAGEPTTRSLRSTAGPYELEVLVNEQRAPQYPHDGQTYVLGQKGQRYILRVWNRSGRRVEAVVSVDGRDVLDGQAADYRTKRGYLVPAWGSVDIDGWRLSSAQAAAFRFAAVADSYAAQTGSARDVGVIGVAVFPERVVPPVVARPQVVRPQRREYDGGGYGGLGDGRAPRRAPSAEHADAGSADEGLAAAPPTASATPSAPMGGSGSAGAPLGDSKSERRAADAGEERSRSSRPGLGTEFGEAVDSAVREVQFVRANAASPSTVFGVRYNNRAGLVALGIKVDSAATDLSLRESADPFRASGRYATPPANWRGR